MATGERFGLAGEIAPADIPACPHCKGQLTMYMPDESLHYRGPVAVCRNDQCGYFLRSGEWTLKQMGISERYRHGYVFADHDGIPIHSAFTDDPNIFWPMGEVAEACKSWCEAVECSRLARYSLVITDDGGNLH